VVGIHLHDTTKWASRILGCGRSHCDAYLLLVETVFG